jgi:hypothetical protein
MLISGRTESPGDSHIRGDVDIPLLTETIGRAFDRTIRLHGDRPALVVSHQQIAWTYAELASQVEIFPCGLLKLRLVRGDRIGVWAPNRAEWTVTQYAAAKLGLVLVNLNPAYRISEIEFALNSRLQGVGAGRSLQGKRLHPNDADPGAGAGFVGPRQAEGGATSEARNRNSIGRRITARSFSLRRD